MCTYEGQRSTSGALSNHTPSCFVFLCIHFWRQGVLLKFKLTCSVRLHGKEAQGRFCLCLCLCPTASLMGYRTLSLPGFCSGSGDPSSGPLAFKANTLTTEPSPSPIYTVSYYWPWRTITLNLAMNIHEFLSERTPSFFWDKCRVAGRLNITVEVCGNPAVAI